MSLIYGVPEMAEEEVLEQIAFQAVQYLRLDDPWFILYQLYIYQ